MITISLWLFIPICILATVSAGGVLYLLYLLSHLFDGF